MFDNRTLTQEITEDFLYCGTDIPETRHRNAVENAARRLERSFAVVADVKETKFGYNDYGYEVRIIATMDADMEEIERATQSVLYWLSEDCV